MTAGDRRERLGSPGLVIDERFRLVDLLGAGAFGEVWRATQIVEGADVREVALKLLRLPSEEGEGATREEDLLWLDEVRAVRDVACEAIVPIYDAGIARSPRVAYISLALLAGQTLQDRLEAGPMHWRRALAIARVVAAAVRACHRAGVCHRDLKPSNIFLDESGRVFVLDFGIAQLGERRAAAPPSAPATAAPGSADGTMEVALDDVPSGVPAPQRRVMGTPGYMAPEVFSDGEAGPAADVFALGVVLYRCIAGALPHRLASGSHAPTKSSSNAEVDSYRAQLHTATIRGDLRPLHGAAPSVPRGVAELVDRLVAADPDARPTDELEAELERAWLGPHGIPDPPYVGLAALDHRRSAFIAGRDADIEAIVEGKLRGDRAVVLVGPSGCGKSSLAVAGVAPGIDRALLDELDGWQAMVVRPSAAGSLAVPSGAGEDEAPAFDTGVVVVIDQLEEILGLEPDDQRALCRAIVSLVDASAPVEAGGVTIPPSRPRRVVMTIRDDFFGDVAALDELDRVPERNVYTVRGVDPNAIDDIVARPARAAGYEIENRAAVVDEARALLEEDTTALPLVQFALARWWEGRNQDRRVLEEAVWRDIGGFHGALSQSAQDLHDGLDDDGKAHMRRLLVSLFRPDGTRVVLEAERVDADAAGVLDALVARRLVMRRQAGDGATLEVVHEALGRRWPPLQQWLEDTRAERELLAAAAEDAARWEDAGQPDEMLWRGGRLAAAIELRDRLGGAREFIARSEHAARRQRRARRGLVAATIAGLAVVSIVLVVLYSRSLSARRDAERARASAQAGEERALLGEERANAMLARLFDERAAKALREADPVSAEVLYAKALTLEDTPERRQHLFDARARRVRSATLAWQLDGVGVFALNESFVATASEDGGTIDIRHAMTGAVLRSVDSGLERIDALAYGGRSGALVAAAYGHRVQLGSDERDELGKTLTAAHVVESLAFHPERALLVGWSSEGITIWDLESEKASAFLPEANPNTAPHTATACSRIRAIARPELETWSQTLTVSVAITTSGPAFDPRPCHQGPFHLVPEPAADRAYAATAVLAAWKDRHLRRVSGSLRLALSAGDDDVVHLTGHRVAPTAAAFTPDGSLVVTAAGKELRVWSSRWGTRLLSLAVEEPIALVRATSLGIAARGERGTLWLWRFASPESLRLPRGVDVRELSGDGRAAVVGSPTPGSAAVERHLVTLAGGATTRLEPLVAPGFREAISGDGSRVAMVSGHEVRVYDDKGALVATMERDQDTVGPTTPGGVPLSSTQLGFCGSAGPLMVSDLSLWAWKFASGAEPAVIVDRSSPASFTGFAISPDGGTLAVADGRARAVRLRRDGRYESTRLATGGAVPRHLSFDGSGRRIAVTDDARNVRLFDVGTREQLAVAEMPDDVMGIAAAPDGRTVAVASGTLVHVIDEHGEMLHTLEGHRAAITALAFTADGAFVVTADQAGEVRIWSASDPATVRSLSVDGAVTALALAAEGDRFAIGLADAVVVLRFDDGSEVRRLTEIDPCALHGEVGCEGAVVGLFFSDDDVLQIVLAGSSEYEGVRSPATFLTWYDLDSGAPTLDESIAGATFHALAIAPSRNWWALWTTGGGHDRVRVGYRRAGRLHMSSTISDLFGDDLGGGQVACTRSGRLAATLSPMETVSVWDVENGREVASLGSDYSVLDYSTEYVARPPAIADDPAGEGGYVLARQSGATTVEIHRSGGAHRVFRYEGTARVTCVALHGDGTRLVAVREDGTAELRDLASSEVLLRARLSDGVEGSLCSTGAVALSSAGTTTIWNLEEVARVFEAPPDALLDEAEAAGSVRVVDIDPVAVTDPLSEGLAAAVEGDWVGAMRALVEVDSEELDDFARRVLRRAVIETAGVAGAIEAPDEEIVAVAVEDTEGRIAFGTRTGEVRIASVEGAELYRLRVDHGRVRTLRWSSTGTRLLVVDEGGNALVVDASGEVLRAPLSGDADAEFEIGPRGERVAYVALGQAGVWDLARERTIRLWGHDSQVTAVRLAPQGATVLTTASGEARLWDAESGDELAVLAHEELRTAGFLEGGKTVVTASESRVKLWDASTGELAREHEGPYLYPVLHGNSSTMTTHSGRVFWRLAGGELTLLASMPSHYGLMTVSATGDHAASRHLGSVVFWNLAEGRPISRYWHGDKQPEADVVRSLAFGFSNNGRLAYLHDEGGSAVVVRRIARGGTLDDVADRWLGVYREGRALASDTGSRASVSEDGRFVASWHERSVYLFDPHLFDRTDLGAHDGKVVYGAFSPDGSLLATGGEDGTVRVWDTAGKKQLRVFRGHRGTVRRVRFSPDGTLVASVGDDRTVQLWSPTTGKVRAVLRHAGVAGDAHFRPDGERVLTGDATGAAAVWSLDGEKLRALEGHEQGIWYVRWSPDGRYAGTASEDGSARVWDPQTGEPVATVRHDGAVWGLDFTRDGRRLATAGHDDAVKVWELPSGELVRRITAHGRAAYRARFNREGNRLLTTGADNRALLWDVDSGEVLHVMAREYVEGDDLNYAYFSPDERWIITAGAGQLLLWSAEPPAAQAANEGHTSWLNGTRIGPRGRRVVTASADATARIWSIAEGRLERTLRGHLRAVTSATFDSTGERVFTTSWDGTARVWSVADGRVLATMRGHEGALTDEGVVAADDSVAVTVSEDETARLWDFETGRLLVTYPHQAWVRSAAVARDGSLVVTGDHEGAVTVWRSSAAERVASWKAHPGAVRSVAFSADGALVVSAGQDGRVKVWKPGSGELVHELEASNTAVSYLHIDVRFVGDTYRLAITGPSLWRVLLVDVDAQEIVWDHTRGGSLSGDGRVAVTAQGLFDVASGARLYDVASEGAPLISSGAQWALGMLGGWAQLRYIGPETRSLDEVRAALSGGSPR